MENSVFFSIIVPVYKVEQYLSKCVESVLSQSFGDFELILVDDGSPDRCPQMCDSYAQTDSRVVVIHKENGGASTARNAGLRAARGKYISFLDSDDFWVRDTVLEDLQKLLTERQADVAVIKTVRYYQESDTFSEKFNRFTEADFSADDYETRLLELIVAQVYRANAWNKVFSRSLMDRTDLFFTEGVIAEDVDWAARLCIAARSICVLPEVAHGYRIGRAGSVTSSLKMKNLIDSTMGIEHCIRYLDDIQVSETFRFAYYSYIAYRYIIWMAESAALRDPAKKPLIREMKKYSWLLNYDGIKRVNTVKRVHRLLGFRATSFLLGIYLKNRTL